MLVVLATGLLIFFFPAQDATFDLINSPHECLKYISMEMFSLHRNNVYCFLPFVVVRIMPPCKDVQVLMPGICKYVILHNQGELRSQMELRLPIS